MEDYSEDGKWDEREEVGTSVHNRKNNVIPLWGNEKTMNLNPLILTNIQSSHYFKVNLYELKTYHEVIDEIYYKVSHLEPWEKGSRKTAGQTGMCGGVRGVGAGGIVSTAFCLLYKLFTLKLTRKQLIGLITHPDSPYIRVLGFMYIRYTQPPADLWDWYEPYLDDPEELDVKAGRGQVMTIGNILKNFLCKLEWFSTLFPRIPVPIQQKLEKKMNERYPPSAPASAPAASNSRRADVSSRNNSRPSYSSPKNDNSNRPDSRDRERSRYSPSRERDACVRARKSCDRSQNRQRSPHAGNGDRNSSHSRYVDKPRYEERYQRVGVGQDQDRHRRSSERERERERKEDDRYGDEYCRKGMKYSHEYVPEKKCRRSETPDRKRSRRRDDGKGDSRSRADDFARHRGDTARRISEERHGRDKNSRVKKSRYDD